MDKNKFHSFFFTFPRQFMIRVALLSCGSTTDTTFISINHNMPTQHLWKRLQSIFIQQPFCFTYNNNNLNLATSKQHKIKNKK